MRTALVIGTMTIGLLLVAQASEAAPSPYRLGTAGSASEVLPTVMARWDTHVTDLNGDSSSETILLSGDGVAQRYDGSDLRWSTGTQDLADHLGLVSEKAAHYVTNAGHILPTSANSVHFTDVNGDGIADVIALAYLAIDQPVAELEGAIITLDGANGQVLDIARYGGFLHHMAFADFDNDGTDEMLLVEEDGPRHLNLAQTHHIGTGNTTRVWVQETNGTVVWQHDAAPWSSITALALADLDADGIDLLLAETSGFADFKPDLDALGQSFTQDVHAIDGATGSLVWSTSVDPFVREIAVGDVDGDLIDDAVLRITEPASTTTSRGDARSYVEALSGLDGSTAWSLQGQLGNAPTVHDIVVRGQALPSVAIAHSNKAASSYSAEDLAHVGLYRLSNGALLTEIRLGEAFLSETNVIGSLLGELRPDRPSLLSDTAQITKMRLALAHIDGDSLLDVVVGTDRAVTGLQVSGSNLVAAWRETVPVDRDVFFTQSGTGNDRVWTNDWRTAHVNAINANTGASAASIPIVSMSPGIVRADLDGDGTKDRAIGGTSQTVFAFHGGTDVLLWKRDLGAYVTHISSDDLDGDGDNDLLVVGDLVTWGLDGQSGSVLWTHEHRFRDNGGSFRAVEFEDMNKDGADDIVLGYRTSRNGGGGPNALAEVLVLSGTTGQQIWSHTLPQPITSVNSVALADVNGDAVPEVAFTTNTITAGIYYGVGVVDGATGLPLWRIDTVEGPGQATLPESGIVFADADGDNDLDVVVAIRGGLVHDAALRAHSGTTGLLIWEKSVDAAGAGKLNTQLVTGGIGPAGAQGMALLSLNPAIDGTTLRVMTPQGGVHYEHDYPGMALVTDLKTGDVDGDGIDDIVIAGPRGLVVVDSGPSLGSGPSHIGHATRWSTGTVALADLDDDGTMEIEFGTNRQTEPIGIGPTSIVDLGRSKAVGRLDLDATIAPPTNLRPVAEFFLTNGPIVEGDNATLQSISYDLDGSIVSETWTLPNGTQLSGSQVNVSFATPGKHSVRLDVMDNEGAVDGYIGIVKVSPLYGFNTSMTINGSYASPGDVLRYNVTVENIGVLNDTFTPRVQTVSSDWNATLLNATPVELGPGESHAYEVELTVGTPRQLGMAAINVTANHTGTVKTESHRVLVPLRIDASLAQGRGPYTALDDITGTARFTWQDGTPVIDMLVKVETADSIQQSDLLRTDDNGTITFDVREEFGIAHQPGTWSLLLRPEMQDYGVRKQLHFDVQAVPGMEGPDVPKLGPAVGDLPSTGL